MKQVAPSSLSADTTNLMLSINESNFPTFLKQRGLSLFPIKNSGSASGPRALQINRNVTFSFKLFLSHQGFPLKQKCLHR
jgi:hypothetical protein